MNVYTTENHAKGSSSLLKSISPISPRSLTVSPTILAGSMQRRQASQNKASCKGDAAGVNAGAVGPLEKHSVRFCNQDIPQQMNQKNNQAPHTMTTGVTFHTRETGHSTLSNKNNQANQFKQLLSINSQKSRQQLQSGLRVAGFQCHTQTDKQLRANLSPDLFMNRSSEESSQNTMSKAYSGAIKTVSRQAKHGRLGKGIQIKSQSSLKKKEILDSTIIGEDSCCPVNEEGSHPDPVGDLGNRKNLSNNINARLNLQSQKISRVGMSSKMSSIVSSKITKRGGSRVGEQSIFEQVTAGMGVSQTMDKRRPQHVVAASQASSSIFHTQRVINQRSFCFTNTGHTLDQKGSAATSQYHEDKRIVDRLDQTSQILQFRQSVTPNIILSQTVNGSHKPSQKLLRSPTENIESSSQVTNTGVKQELEDDENDSHQISDQNALNEFDQSASMSFKEKEQTQVYPNLYRRYQNLPDGTTTFMATSNSKTLNQMHMVPNEISGSSEYLNISNRLQHGPLMDGQLYTQNSQTSNSNVTGSKKLNKLKKFSPHEINIFQMEGEKPNQLVRQRKDQELQYEYLNMPNDESQQSSGNKNKECMLSNFNSNNTIKYNIDFYGQQNHLNQINKGQPDLALHPQHSDPTLDAFGRPAALHTHSLSNNTLVSQNTAKSSQISKIRQELQFPQIQMNKIMYYGDRQFAFNDPQVLQQQPQDPKSVMFRHLQSSSGAQTENTPITSNGVQQSEEDTSSDPLYELQEQLLSQSQSQMAKSKSGQKCVYQVSKKPSMADEGLVQVNSIGTGSSIIDNICMQISDIKLKAQVETTDSKENQSCETADLKMPQEMEYPSEGADLLNHYQSHTLLNKNEANQIDDFHSFGKMAAGNQYYQLQPNGCTCMSNTLRYNQQEYLFSNHDISEGGSQEIQQVQGQGGGVRKEVNKCQWCRQNGEKKQSQHVAAFHHQKDSSIMNIIGNHSTNQRTDRQSFPQLENSCVTFQYYNSSKFASNGSRDQLKNLQNFQNCFYMTRTTNQESLLNTSKYNSKESGTGPLLRIDTISGQREVVQRLQVNLDDLNQDFQIMEEEVECDEFNHDQSSNEKFSTQNEFSKESKTKENLSSTQKMDINISENINGEPAQMMDQYKLSQRLLSDMEQMQILILDDERLKHAFPDDEEQPPIEHKKSKKFKQHTLQLKKGKSVGKPGCIINEYSQDQILNLQKNDNYFSEEKRAEMHQKDLCHLDKTQRSGSYKNEESNDQSYTILQAASVSNKKQSNHLNLNSDNQLNCKSYIDMVETQGGKQSSVMAFNALLEDHANKEEHKQKDDKMWQPLIIQRKGPDQETNSQQDDNQFLDNIYSKINTLTALCGEADKTEEEAEASKQSEKLSQISDNKLQDRIVSFTKSIEMMINSKDAQITVQSDRINTAGSNQQEALDELQDFQNQEAKSQMLTSSVTSEAVGNSCSQDTQLHFKSKSTCNQFEGVRNSQASNLMITPSQQSSVKDFKDIKGKISKWQGQFRSRSKSGRSARYDNLNENVISSSVRRQSMNNEIKPDLRSHSFVAPLSLVPPIDPTSFSKQQKTPNKQLEQLLHRSQRNQKSCRDLTHKSLTSLHQGGRTTTNQKENQSLKSNIGIGIKRAVKNGLFQNASKSRQASNNLQTSKSNEQLKTDNKVMKNKLPKQAGISRNQNKSSKTLSIAKISINSKRLSHNNQKYIS